jgi:hypothetical protein
MGSSHSFPQHVRDDVMFRLKTRVAKRKVDKSKHGEIMQRFFLLMVIASAFFINCNTLLCQWVSANGPYGGTVTSFASNGSSIFAGTSGGVYRSTDNGSTWTFTSNGLTTLNITSLFQTGGKIYAGTSSGGFVSSDNGGTWNSLLAAGLTFWQVNCFAANGSTIYAGTSNGPYISTNSGTQWAPDTAGISNIIVKSLTVYGNYVFAGTMSTIYRAPLSGGKWVIPYTPSKTNQISSFVSLRGTLFAGDGTYGVLASSDSGKSWLSTSTTFPMTYPSIYALGTDGNRVFAGLLTGLYVTADSGGHWTESDNGIVQKFVNALLVQGTTIFAGTNGLGVFRSTDSGGHWTSSSTGLMATSGFALVTDSTNVYAATQGGVFRKTVGGTNWTSVNSGNENFSTFSLMKNGGNLYSGTGLGIYRSTDNGSTWTGVALGNPFLPVYALSSIGTRLAAGTYAGMMTSTNGGTVWTWTADSLTSINIVSFGANTYGSSPAYFAGTQNGAFISTSGGTSWSTINNGFPPYTNVLSYLTIRDTTLSTKAVVLAGTPTGVYRSSDNGTSWSLSSSGFPSTYTSVSMFQLVQSGSINNIFAATSYGVYRSTDKGVNWVSVNTGLPTSGALSLLVVGTNLFAGMASRGVWGRPLSEVFTDIAPQDNRIPVSFLLEQNYPNPFNPTTRIAYEIPPRAGSGLQGAGSERSAGSGWSVAGSQVRLVIYDVLGRQVAVLVDGVQSPGRHEVDFNAGKLASGIYVYRLTAGSFAASRKMTILR